MTALTGAFAQNVVQFARVLRNAGLRVGPSSVLDALRALEVIDLGRREDVRACLRAVLVRRQEDLALFEHAFRLFFRAPTDLDSALAMLLPHAQTAPATADPVPRRLAEALHPPAPRRPPPPPREPPLEFDAALTFSERESLRTRDFAEMSAAELAAAQKLVARLRFAVEPRPVRRLVPAPRGPRLDLRRMMRAGLRSGGADLPLRFRAPRIEPSPLVVICDISGSMARYTEMLLRFVHTLMLARRRVSCFLLGTRLSNVTRALRGRDIDAALRRCSKQVPDWGGGTQLGPCLHEFNRTWSRRVLGQGAVVLLITDGLDRAPGTELGHEAERLSRSCRRLVWLNPLLGFAGFEPRAQGIRALLPHVDEHRPVHNLESLEQLAAALHTRS